MKSTIFEVKSTFDALLLVISLILHIAVGFTGLVWAMVITTVVLAVVAWMFFTRLNRIQPTFCAFPTER
jgi:hypothetical protein